MQAAVIHGCIQYLVQPKGLKDGEIIKSEWIDEGQLIRIKETEILKDKEEPGGGIHDIPSGLNHP